MLRALFYIGVLLNSLQLVAQHFAKTSSDPNIVQRCETNLADPALKNYLKYTYWNTWEMVNSERGIHMFGCKPILPHEYEPYRTPIENCFNKVVNGKPIYPLVAEQDYSRSWSFSDSEQNMRVIKFLKWDQELSLNIQSTHWMHSSADGRYIGGAMKDQVYIVDLLFNRISTVSADYGPAFFPSNESVSFMQSEMHTWFCNQYLLSLGRTRYSLVDHPNYCYRDTPSTCADLPVNPFGLDNFVVRSDSYEYDRGDIKAFRDPDVSKFANQNSKLEVRIVAKEYETPTTPKPTIVVPQPFEGDFSTSPKGTILLSRFTSEGDPSTNRVQLGYKLKKISIINTETVGLEEIGTICLSGARASMSFNERFFVTHQYKPTAGIGDHDPQRFIKSKSDVYLVDLWTGKTHQVTNMSLGQYALYPHFRNDNWMYILVQDMNSEHNYLIATDVALRIGALEPIKL